MIEKIAKNVYKIPADSNVYLLILEEPIIIDAGPRAYNNIVKEELSKIINLKNVKKAVLTHIHYDHSGNIDLFPNADIFASKKEIGDFKKNPIVAFNLNPKMIIQLRKKLKSIETIMDFLT